MNNKNFQNNIKIKLTNLKTFIKINNNIQIPILNSIDLKFYKNNINSILGISGIGKSSLFWSLFKIKNFDHSGTSELFLNNNDTIINLKTVSNIWIQNNILGHYITVIGQNPHQHIHPYLTIKEQLLEVINVNNYENPIKEIYKILNLLSFKDNDFILRSLPSQLSTGMLQRVLLAMALCPKPEIIIADEFLSALDFEIKRSILTLLINICKKKFITLIWITHNLKLALHYSNYVTIINHNRKISYAGNSEKLKFGLKNNKQEISNLF